MPRMPRDKSPDSTMALMLDLTAAVVAGSAAGIAGIAGGARDVEWILPEGRLTYWRGRIVKAEYE